MGIDLAEAEVGSGRGAERYCPWRREVELSMEREPVSMGKKWRRPWLLPSSPAGHREEEDRERVHVG